MQALRLEPNLSAPDEFYEALIAAHRGLSDHDSARLNARLVLLLANHVGEMSALREALALARDGLAPPATPDSSPKADR